MKTDDIRIVEISDGLKAQAAEAAESIRRIIGGFQPEVGIFLGTGLSKAITEGMEERFRIDYGKIPHFNKTSIKSHEGALIFGMIGQRKVVVLSGRYHYYEGYPMSEVVFPSFVLAALGVKDVIITSAVGGLNKSYAKGDLVMLGDHINLTGLNPLMGFRDSFYNAMELYDKTLRKKAQRIAKEQGVRLHEGTMFFLPGPSFETRAELRAIGLLGGDTIGWSSVPEAMVCGYLGIRVLAINCVTDLSDPDTLKEAELSGIIEVAEKSSEGLYILIREILKEK
jgi:purine-nucleoside phosphorylase